jgi:energy-coupling factor transport system permease protein
VVFRAVLGGAYGPDAHVLFTLPTITLPEAAAGISLGGPVTAESLLAAAYDGLRLATMLVCLGAANSLANPRRMLKSLPGALYEVGMAVVVALSIAPQLVESVLRVRRARRLRENPPRGLHALGGILLPVLEDALDRSLHLAASMDARGYGRRGAVTPAERRRSGALVVAGLLGVCAGLFGLLGGITGSRALGLVMLLAGGAVAVAGMVLGGRHVQRTRYRPDPWRGAEWLVAGSGLACAAVLFAVAWADPLQLTPVLQPLSWPALPLLPAAAILLTAAPAVWTPRPASRPKPAHLDGVS